MSSSLARLVVPFGPVCAALMALPPAAASAGVRCDLSIDDVFIDYDPRTPIDIDDGPGRQGQDLALIIVISNTGLLPIVSARLSVGIFNDACGAQGPIDITDFDPLTPGTQRLEPFDSTFVRLLVPADVPSCCGSYTIEVTHESDRLRCMDGAIPVIGDGDPTNDSKIDRPDAESAPDDCFSPDLLVIDPIFIDLSLRPESFVIEDVTTERLLVDAHAVSSGPIPVTGTFFFDLVDSFNPSIVYVANLIAPQTRTFGSLDRMRLLRFNLNGVPGIPSAVPLRLSVRFGRPSALATCGRSLSQAFVVQ